MVTKTKKYVTVGKKHYVVYVGKNGRHYYMKNGKRQYTNATIKYGTKPKSVRGSRKSTTKSRKCTRGVKKSGGCKKKPGPKRGSSTRKSRKTTRKSPKTTRKPTKSRKVRSDKGKKRGTRVSPKSPKTTRKSRKTTRKSPKTTRKTTTSRKVRSDKGKTRKVRSDKGKTRRNRVSRKSPKTTRRSSRKVQNKKPPKVTGERKARPMPPPQPKRKLLEIIDDDVSSGGSFRSPVSNFGSNRDASFKSARSSFGSMGSNRSNRERAIVPYVNVLDDIREQLNRQQLAQFNKQIEILKKQQQANLLTLEEIKKIRVKKDAKKKLDKAIKESAKKQEKVTSKLGKILRNAAISAAVINTIPQLDLTSMLESAQSSGMTQYNPPSNIYGQQTMAENIPSRPSIFDNQFMTNRTGQITNIDENKYADIIDNPYQARLNETSENSDFAKFMTSTRF